MHTSLQSWFCMQLGNQSFMCTENQKRYREFSLKKGLYYIHTYSYVGYLLRWRMSSLETSPMMWFCHYLCAKMCTRERLLSHHWSGDQTLPFISLPQGEGDETLLPLFMQFTCKNLCMYLNSVCSRRLSSDYYFLCTLWTEFSAKIHCTPLQSIRESVDSLCSDSTTRPLQP